MDFLNRPPTGVFPHHLQRLVRCRGRLERPEQPVCCLGPCRWRGFPHLHQFQVLLKNVGYFCRYRHQLSLASTALQRMQRVVQTPTFLLTSTRARERSSLVRTPLRRLVPGVSSCGSGHSDDRAVASVRDRHHHLVGVPLASITWISLGTDCSPAAWYARHLIRCPLIASLSPRPFLTPLVPRQYCWSKTPITCPELFTAKTAFILDPGFSLPE